MVPKTMLGGKLLRRAKKSIEGGTEINFDVQLETIAPGQWVGANTKLELKGTKTTTRGSVPWRFYQDAWYMDLKLIDLNKGTKHIVFNLLQNAKEQVCVATITEFESKILAYDGNGDHDGVTGSGGLHPLGLRYWGTFDGQHLLDASATVAGIQPTATRTNGHDEWLNPYINPVSSSDFGTAGAIGSVRDVPEAMERMAMEMYFESADVWGTFAKDIKHNKKFDPDSKQTPEDLMIVCDRLTNVKYRDVLFQARDDVTYTNQSRGRPSWKGIPVDWDINLGYGSAGVGYDRAGTSLSFDFADSTPGTLGVDRADYTEGGWKSAGEMMFLNTKWLYFVTHPDHAPMTKKPYMPEGMFGMAMEYDFYLQTVCRSRRRGIGVIAGYSVEV
jgi:hypothetical protein